MSEATLLTLVDRVHHALQAEIDIVREGRFQDLMSVQQETALAVRDLEAVQVDLHSLTVNKDRIETALAHLNRTSQQARDLIGAALNGARDARNRVENLIRSDGEIGAYDRSGGQIMMKNLASPYNKTI